MARNGGGDKPGLGEALWYKDAIIYELRVRSFMDSNGDGIGDFPGLTEKLDYLQDLGVTTLWLLPFYPSPGKDDGYDIAEYFDVHADMGTLDDFRTFLDEAHKRGLKVITELVVNHTSDQHPWFQRARRSPPGSSYRDFYVWSDTPDRYKEARIIFKDFEPSNWSWDPVAKGYYWHRFFNHQPDLNYDNPAVHDAIFQVVDFWFGMGVDGMRLDAVPYLFEREGTNCENLPETHAFLKKLRSHVDQKFPARMLLAEANQWPEDAASYFGNGDECHMNFHFPIMPRLFMSIHMEDRFPIIDILAQTPQLPEVCQWATFLRNHDELTLEMVTDEERDYMYRAFAHDPTMRINLGIRRRLAPLVGNDRKNIELMNGLLFSLPGTPVLYYGDELGMGDNIYLGDRNGVRTPMQWSSDRNAGFSRANPQRLILPTIIDPEYHYESVNVEAQQNNPNSLLWWTKRLISLRKRYKAFGRGALEFLQPDNPRVLAFVRTLGDQTILVVANLARFVQYVELDLGKYKGLTPRELFGRTRFPAVGDLPYLLTLPGRGFYWFVLEPAKTAAADARVAGYTPPLVELQGTPEAFFSGRDYDLLEEVLPAYLAGRRWYGGGDRPISAATVREVLPLTPNIRVALIRVEYTEGEPQTYALAVAWERGRKAEEVRIRSSQALIADLKIPGESDPGVLYDALADAGTSPQVTEAVVKNSRVKAGAGELVSRTVTPLTVTGAESRFLKDEHTNATVVFGDKYLLKFFRMATEGPSPEADIGEFLHAHNAKAPVPQFVGALEYRPRRAEPVTLATVTQYVPNEGLGWAHARDDVRRFFERVLTQRDGKRPERPRGGWLAVAEAARSGQFEAIVGNYLQTAALLGRRTAELHLALASDPADPRFALEPYSAMDQRSAYQSMRNTTGRVLRTLKRERPTLTDGSRDLADRLLGRENELYRRFEPLLGAKLTALRGRCHANLHLGQVLFTGRDFVFIDFEGDRMKAASDRLRKRSPLRDVASMIRSYHYAAFTGLFDLAVLRREDRAEMVPWAQLWAFGTSGAFLGGYLEAADGAGFVPADKRELSLLLETFVLERALDEVSHELERKVNRVDIPLLGLLAMLDD